MKKVERSSLWLGLFAILLVSLLMWPGRQPLIRPVLAISVAAAGYAFIRSDCSRYPTAIKVFVRAVTILLAAYGTVLILVFLLLMASMELMKPVF